MGLLELSKFKLQLRTLITEVQELRERERSATEQLHLQIQKQKQNEEEHSRKFQELQTELALSKELRQKLERKVSCLQDDNALLEHKQKELKETIQSLLQSRESFVNAYEESTCEMKRSIETRDRKLTVLSEKIKSHLLLFDSIVKEAFCIKQVVNDVQCLVSEKEEVVAGLKSKMDKVPVFEKVFVEKISNLEHKLKNDEDELQRKDRIILELEAHLEAARSRNNYQNEIEELQKTLSAKDAVIQNFISEKEELHSEVGCLSIILQKIQDTVTNMNEEDKRVFSSILECQEGCDIVMGKEVDGTENGPQTNIEKYPNKTSETDCTENAENHHMRKPMLVDTIVGNNSLLTHGDLGALGVGQASLLCEEYKKVAGTLGEDNNNDSCVSESGYSESQSAANVPSISANDGQVHCTRSVHHLDSECSTTQAEPQKIQECDNVLG